MKRPRSRAGARSVSAVLTRMTTRSPLGSLMEGEAYICAVCNLPVKPCAGNPTHVCRAKLRRGTVLEQLEQVTKAASRGDFGRCAACGKPFTRREKLSDPLRELCRSCQQSNKPTRRKARRQERKP